MSVPSVSRILKETTAAICSSFDNIKFPMSSCEQRSVKEGFHGISGFPRVLGCIDGTLELVPIQGPSGIDEPAYGCRKGFHAINAQAVCGANLRPVPTLEVGPHTAGVSARILQSPMVDPIFTGHSDLFSGTVEVVPTETGSQKVCIKTDTRSSGAKVCYHLQVSETAQGTDGVSKRGTVLTLSPAKKDNFLEPTPKDGSRLRCIPNEDCHVIVHSKQELGKWPGDTPRCFHIHPTPVVHPCYATLCDDVHGACILESNNMISCVCDDPYLGATCAPILCHPNPCSGVGLCSPRPSLVCHCPVGYNGTLCETVPTAPVKSSFSGPNPMNGATLMCDQGQTCTIPVYVKTDKSGTSSLELGPTNLETPRTIAKPLTPDPSLVTTGMSKGEIGITPTVTGLRPVCVKVSSPAAGQKDTMCVRVGVQSTHGAPTGQSSKDLFKSPSLPENSVLQCQTGIDCHVMVYSKPSREHCPNVTKDSSSNIDVYIFPSTTATSSSPITCVTDVSVTPDPSQRGDVCIQAKSRPVFKKDCHHGACLRNGASADCACDVNYTPESACKEIITSTTTMALTSSSTPTAPSTSRKPITSSIYKLTAAATSSTATTTMLSTTSATAYPTTSHLTSPRMEDKKNETVLAGVSATVLAPSVAVPVAVVGGVGCVFFIKHCYAKCSLKNLAEVSPIGSLPEPVSDDEDEEEEDMKEKKMKKKKPEEEVEVDQPVSLQIRVSVYETDGEGNQMVDIQC